MKFKKTLSLFAIYLIISLIVIIPLEVSGFSVQISGEDGVPGFRKVEDKTIINATAQSPISINKGGTDYPMDCANQNGLFVCNHEFEKSTLKAGEYVLSFTQEKGTPKSVSWSFIVDEDSPLINSFQVEPKGNGKLGLSYDISDSAFFSDSSKCSGIKSITLSSDDKTIFQQLVPGDVCSKQEDNYSIDVMGISGDVQFYLTVTDKLGHTTTANSNVLPVDFKKPKISDDVVVKAGNRTIEYVSQQPQIAPYVTLEFTVTEENLQSVVADLSQVSRNPKHTDEYASKTLTCQNIGLKNICKAENIELNPGQATIQIPITATDTAGNVVKKTLTKQFTLINKQGEITYFGPSPEHCDGGTCYVKNSGTNKILIQVTGADAGVDKSLITLATGELSGISAIHATRCNETVSGLHSVNDCYAMLPIHIPGDQSVMKKLSLTRPTTDLMGTELKGKTSVDLMVDSVAPTPVISDVTKNIIRSVPGCSIAGENLDLTIAMKDDVSTKLFIGTTTNLTTGKTNFSNECKDDGSGIFNCTLTISDFVSYPEKETVPIIVRDLAGNKYSQEFNISVCEANNEYPPNFISSITSSTNFKIDRRVASVMPVKVYLPLDIHIKNDATILDLTHDNCIGMNDLGGQPYFIGKTSKQPILVVPLGGTKGTILPDTININCTISAYEKRGSVRFLQPEVEPVVAQVEAYDLAIGGPNEAAIKKLQTLGREVQDLDLKIRKHMSWMVFFLWLCELDGLFSKINQIISVAKSVVYAVSLAANVVGAGDGIWSAACPVFQKINKLLSKIYPTNMGVEAVSKLIKGGISKKVGVGPVSANIGTNGVGASVNAEGVSASTGSDAPSGVQKAQNSASSAVNNDNIKLSLGYFFKAGCLFVHCAQCSPGGVIKMASLLVKTASVHSTYNDNEISKEDAQNIKESARKAIDDNNKKIKLDEGVIKQDLNFLKTSESELAQAKHKLKKYGTPGHDKSSIPIELLNDVASKQKKVDSWKQTISEEQKPIEKNKLDNIHQRDLIKANRFSSLNTKGVPNEWDSFMDDQAHSSLGQNEFAVNPFNNIVNSRSCFCITGNIYNFNKLKQLYCKEIKCMQASLTTGYPPLSTCETTMASEKCLYYDGALNKRSTGFGNKMGHWISNQFDSVMARPFNTAFSALCSIVGYTGDIKLLGKASKGVSKVLGNDAKLTKASGSGACKSQATGWIDVTCALRLAYIQIRDLTEQIENGYFEGTAGHDLTPDTDFCAGLDTTLGLLPQDKSHTPTPGQTGLFTGVSKKITYPDVEKIEWLK